MPLPDRNQWHEAWQATKERTEAAREQLAQWSEAVREEPILIWETPAIRYTVYVVGCLIAFTIINALISGLQLPPSNIEQPRATTANFDVICANPDCGRHFVIERKFKFHDFPVPCPYCRTISGHRALRCYTDTCRGRLVPVIERDRRFICTQCGIDLGGR